MIVENRLMWPSVCFRYRLDDEPRYLFDSLLHTVYTSAAREILITPTPYLYEKAPIRFYDLDFKTRLYKKKVFPVLRSVFLPKGHHTPLEEPWIIDDGRLALIWQDLADFFTTFLWCSKLRIPFVFDVDGFSQHLAVLRDYYLREQTLADLRPLNDLIAIMSLYQLRTAECLTPTVSSRGNAVELWNDLRTYPTYRNLSHQTRRLGVVRANTVEGHLHRIKTLAQRASNLKGVSPLVKVTKTAVSLFLGPSWQFASEVVGRAFSIVLQRQYVPPIYSLSAIEEATDDFLYPELRDWRTRTRAGVDG